MSTSERLVLRSRAERGVSNDAPGGANKTASWAILRDAMLRIAPQDEAVALAPVAPRAASRPYPARVTCSQSNTLRTMISAVAFASRASSGRRSGGPAG